MENMVDNLKNIYKKKKVFITGNTGFKGSWISMWLLRLGADVSGYSLDIPTETSHFNLLKLSMETIFGDIRDKEKLRKTILEIKPDIIFHLAAQSLVFPSYKKPLDTFYTNIMGTANLFESCLESENIKAIINITSDKCYRNFNTENKIFSENDPLGGNDPYSASKACSEIITNSYIQSFFNPKDYKKTHNILISSARAGNVLGGGDWADHRIIPDIIRSVILNSPVIIRNPDYIRPWQHVLDSIFGYLLLGTKLLEGKIDFVGPWNFGPVNNNNITVLDLVKKAKDVWNSIEFKIEQNNIGIRESKYLRLDSEKSREMMGWKNVWSEEKTIFNTINWYKNYYENKNIFSEQDINKYELDLKNAYDI